MPINPIIEEKIKASDYRKEIKDLLMILLEYEDFNEKANEKYRTSQYDKIISNFVSKDEG